MRFNPLALTVLVAVLAFTSHRLHAADPAFADLVRVAPVPGGLLVHAGATSAGLAVAAAEAGPWVVAVIPANAASAVAIRADLAKRKLLGQVTLVDGLAADSSVLPFPANSITMLVCDGDALGARLPSAAELQRVLRPDAVARIGRGGTWTPVVKARPAAMDGWAQFHGDSTQNDRNQDALVGQPRGLQWVAGSGKSVSVGIRTNGKVLVMPEDYGKRLPDQQLVGRDPFTGARLWQIPLKVSNQYAFLMDEQRVYVLPYSKDLAPMVALDPGTGKELLRYDQGMMVAQVDQDAVGTKESPAMHWPWPKALVCNGVLVQWFANTIYALDPATGKLLWKQSLPDGEIPGYVAADGDLVIATEGTGYGTANSYIAGFTRTGLSRIVARSLKTGATVWTWSWNGPKDPFGPEVSHLVIGEGRVGAAIVRRTDAKQQRLGNGHLLNLDFKTGKQMWLADHSNKIGGGPLGLVGHGYSRTMIRDGAQWLVNFSGLDRYELADGTPGKSEWTYNQRCHPSRTAKTLAFGSLFTTSLIDDRVYWSEAARSTCDLGTFPANGLLYQLASTCGCFAWMPSSNAFTAEAPPTPLTGNRLEKGLATAAPSPAGDWPGADGWPMHMRDVRRSNWVETAIASKPAVAWTTTYKAPPVDPVLSTEWAANTLFTSPVGTSSHAEGAVIVPLPDQQAVVRLDPVTGKEVWRAQVDGRVDSAPTIYRGLVLFGTRLGWVYALNRDDGKLVWRFFAAPSPRNVVALGQIESAWPVFGSVAMLKGTLWVAAGREISIDDGFQWWGLDPLTGAVHSQARTGFSGEWSRLSKLEKGKRNLPDPSIGRFGCAASPVVSDGTNLFMQQFGLDVATGERIAAPPLMGPKWKPDLPRIILPGSQGFAYAGDLGGSRYGPASLYVDVAAKIHAIKNDEFIALACGKPHLSGREPGMDSWLKRFSIQPQKDPKTGWSKEEWKLPLPFGREVTDKAQALAVAGDTVMYATGPTLFGVAYADGAPKWEVPLPAQAIFAGISVAVGQITVVCQDGSVVGIR